MKKVFGIAGAKYAYFYEMDTNDQVKDVIGQLKNDFYVQKEDVVLCDFYDNKVHNYGIYQNDINDGYASVIDVRIMHVDRSAAGFSKKSSSPRFGVIQLSIVYQSQIYSVIKNIFDPEQFGEQYKPIDFTDMMKIVNSLDSIPNSFTYDPVVDKRLRYMNVGFDKNLDEINDINKKLFLNEKEKGMSLDDYYEIISKLADNTKFKLVATYDLEKTYNEEIEDMKRYAIRNSKLVEMPIFNPILNKLDASLIDNKKTYKSVSSKKYEYRDKCNVYLQKDNMYGIM